MLLLGRCCAVSLLSGCSHCAVLLLSRHSCPVCQQGGLRWGNVLTWCPGMNNNERRTMTNGHHSSFGCHIADSNVAPGTRVNKINERGGCADSPNVDGDDIVRLHR